MTDLPDALKSLAREYNLSEFYVFGSRANEIAARVRGQTADASHPDSDVDIGVRPRPGTRLTARDRVRLTIDLEDLFEANRVDLVVLPEASAFLALEVIRGELLSCEDEEEQAEYELYVLRRAGDLAPFEWERREMILGGGAGDVFAAEGQGRRGGVAWVPQNPGRVNECRLCACRRTRSAWTSQTAARSPRRSPGIRGCCTRRRATSQLGGFRRRVRHPLARIGRGSQHSGALAGFARSERRGSGRSLNVACS